MLDTSAIRRLNKVKIFPTDSTKDTSHSEINCFEAYLKSGNSLGLAIKTDDAFGGMADRLMSHSAIRQNIINTALEGITGNDFTTALDIQRKVTFMGGTPLSFSIQCVKFVENDYNTDVIEPITRLCKMVLPNREREVFKQLMDKASDFVTDKASSHNEKVLKTNPDASPTGGVWGLAQNAIDWFNAYVGEVWVLSEPTQFKRTTSLVLKMPGMEIPDIFIKGVNLGFPYVTYVGNDGNEVIEKVDITLNIETQRIATGDYFTLFNKKVK